MLALALALVLAPMDCDARREPAKPCDDIASSWDDAEAVAGAKS